MKAFVLFCFALIVGSAWSFVLPETMKYMSECKRLEGADSSEIMDERFRENETPSQEAKCFYKCLLEKTLLFHEGNISPLFKLGAEALLKEPSSNPQMLAVMRAFKECFDTTGVDSCDLAYNFMKCLRPKMQRMMFH